MPTTALQRRPRACAELKNYLRELPQCDREPFAGRCGTTLKFLLQVAYGGKSASAELAMAIDLQSHGRVPAERVRPDLAATWCHMRRAAVEAE